MKWIVGVDEAGRGPLAGPVVVGAVRVARDFDWSLFAGLTDSKKLSERRREALFACALEAQHSGALNFSTEKVCAPVIDRDGITKAVACGVARTLDRVVVDPGTTHIKLDGLLRAPGRYSHQDTIIKGDVTEKEISLASIMAKVTRDRYMVRAARRYSGYGFEIHKGYGTKVHRAAIIEQGLSSLHRKSYCTSFIKR